MPSCSRSTATYACRNIVALATPVVLQAGGAGTRRHPFAAAYVSVWRPVGSGSHRRRHHFHRDHRDPGRGRRPRRRYDAVVALPGLACHNQTTSTSVVGAGSRRPITAVALVGRLVGPGPGLGWALSREKSLGCGSARARLVLPRWPPPCIVFLRRYCGRGLRWLVASMWPRSLSRRRSDLVVGSGPP